MLREGHAVEFHCTHHLRHTGLSLGAIREDTRTGLRGLRALGVSPRLWRPPWGVATPRTRKVAREHGLSLVGWSADTHDWRGDRARRMLDAATQEMRPGAIVLMHDGIGPGARRTGCEETVALIPVLAGVPVDLVGVWTDREFLSPLPLQDLLSPSDHGEGRP